MTLRDLLKVTDFVESFKFIRGYFNDENPPEFYADALKELINLPYYDKPVTVSIHTYLYEDIFMGESIMVSDLLNLSYERDYDEVLDGPYAQFVEISDNESKITKHFAMDLWSWDELIDCEIINEIPGITNEQLLGVILFECTYYGFTQAEIRIKLEEFKNLV